MSEDGGQGRSAGRAGAPRAVVVVPARLASLRLPRKMLLRETGQYLFEHTVRNAERARSVARVVLATDAPEILTAAAEVGVEALNTSSDHASGTDRVHEAFEKLPDRDTFDVVVNVQGDEPELPAVALDALVSAFADPNCSMATLATPLHEATEAALPSVVKVVVDARGNALYFSRARIPADRDGARGAAGGWLRHVGVYAFRPNALRRYCALPRGRLEQRECLEQLRWLEAGLPLRVLEVAEVPVGIDTPNDYRLFVERQRALSGSP